MCSINHDLKAIYIHVPKCGGLFVQKILEKYYGFETCYFTHENHKYYINIDPEESDPDKILEGFLRIRKGGVLRYFMTSKKHDEKTNMTPEKWSEYKKFTVVRNPYDKFISSYTYIQKMYELQVAENINEYISKKDTMNNYPFFHSFITQKDQLLDINNEIHIDYFINFHNLNTELCDVLLNLGVPQIKHRAMLLNDSKINMSKSDNYSNYYDEKILRFVNEHFKSDFELLSFPMIETVEDLVKDSDNYYVTPEAFTKKNIKLLIDLDKRNAICELNNIEEFRESIPNPNITMDNGLSIEIEEPVCAPKPKNIFEMLLDKLVIENGGVIIKTQKS